MSGRSLWREEDAETSLSQPQKRQKTSHFDNSVRQQYTIAWICALYKEMTAARAMLDNIHQAIPRHVDDTNTYILGNIKQHLIVIACLPEGQYGTNTAANIVANIKRTFPAIRMGLMVGIGGGVPSKADIRLGDVVIGTKVIQHDLGKATRDGQFQRTAFPRIPPYALLTAVSNLRSKHDLESSRIPTILQLKLGGYPKFSRPSRPDRLFRATYDHESMIANCDGCDQSKTVERNRRDSNEPMIHYGAIASGNQVIKNSTVRDSLAEQLDVICFEMEAAGMMDVLPCLSIRGICDYSDSHKSDEWQNYAAATAAACAREFLEDLPITEPDADASSIPHHSSKGSQDRFKIVRESFDVELVPFFTERSVEVNEIRKLFQPSRSRTTVVLYGLGGIGKTQVALKYAYDFKDEYSAIFWIDYRNADVAKQSLFAAAERIQRKDPFWPGMKEALDSNDLDKASLIAIDWLSQEENDKWLIICDGYDQSRSEDTRQKQLDLHRMIRTHHGHILITSRWQQSDLWHHVPIEKFTDLDHGVELLLKRSGRPSLRDDRDIQKLAEKLDGLPLALVAAGAYLGTSLYTCSKYLSVYNRSWLRLLEETPKSDAYDRTLFSTWNLNWERICEINKLAARLLQFGAYFDNKDLWFELLQTSDGIDKPEWLQSLTEDEFEFEVAVRTLREHALVEEQINLRHGRNESLGFSIHNCVHSWTIHVLNKNWNYEMSSFALNCIARKLPQNSTPSFWYISQRILAHANHMIDLFSQKRLFHEFTEVHVEQMQDVIGFFLILDRPGTVEKVCINLHEQVEKEFGYYHPATFVLKWLTIGIFTSLKKYDEAETLCNHTLSQFNDQPSVHEGNAKRSFTLLLARNLFHRGQTEKAEALLLGTSAPAQNEQIGDLVFERNTVSQLWTQYLVKDIPKGMQTWMEYHVRKEKAEHVKSCQQSFNLLCTQVSLCLSRNEHGKARALIVDAREIFDRERSADYAKAFMFPALAALYAKMDEKEDLKSLCDNATIEDWESLWQSDAQLSYIVVLTRSYAHFADGQLDETIALCQQILNKLHDGLVLGSAHKKSLRILLGSAYMQQGKLWEAEKQFTATIQEQRESQQHRTSASYGNALATMGALAELYKYHGEQDSAQRCLQLMKRYQEELANERHGGVDV